VLFSIASAPIAVDSEPVEILSVLCHIAVLNNVSFALKANLQIQTFPFAQVSACHA